MGVGRKTARRPWFSPFVGAEPVAIDAAAQPDRRG